MGNPDMNRIVRKLFDAIPGSDESVSILPNRILRTTFHRNSFHFKNNSVRGKPPETMHLLGSTITLFESHSLRKPNLLPRKPLDMSDVLQRLAELDRAGFHLLDFAAQRSLDSAVEMAAEILYLQRVKSDDQSGFDAACVRWAGKLKSDLASRAVVLFFESWNEPGQAELLAELGAVSHGLLRKRIRQALKNMHRPDLLDCFGGGGPSVIEPEPAPAQAPAPAR